MLLWALSLGAVALAYGCEHPSAAAERGLLAQFAGRRWVAAVYRAVYAALSTGYALLHRREPAQHADCLARFAWSPGNRDAQLQVETSAVLDALVSMQTHEVASGAFAAEFADMRRSVRGADFCDWHDLGFQGRSPETDFRGAGALGVVLLHAFCTQREAEARRLVVESRSTTSQNELGPWYPMALVSIRLSMALCELLKRQRVLLFGVLLAVKNRGGDWLAVLKQTHAELLVAFHEKWLRGVAGGDVKTYFDTEFVLKEVESQLPVDVLRLTAHQ